MKGWHALAALLVLPTLVFAHGWYDPDCCSDTDCFHERDGQRVTGFQSRSGTYVVRFAGQEWHYDPAQTRRSQDGEFHICWPKWAERPICVYVPDAGV